MEPLGNPSQLSNVEVNLKFLQNYLVCGAGGCPGVSMLTFYSDDLSSNPADVYYFCLWPTAEGPSNYLSCSCSRHFINLLLGCTSGLNLAADLGPVLALLLCKNCLTRTKKRPVLANCLWKFLIYWPCLFALDFAISKNPSGIPSLAKAWAARSSRRVLSGLWRSSGKRVRPFRRWRLSCVLWNSDIFSLKV